MNADEVGAGDPAAETAANYDAAAADRLAGYLEPSRLADVRRTFLRRLAAGSRIADVGCGPGRDVAAFKAAGYQAMGFDRSSRFVAIANRIGNGPVILADMRRLPLPSASVDAVWCAGALVHLPRREAPTVLAEFRRVTRDGGLLCLIVKQGSDEYWRPGPDGTRSFVAPHQHAALDALLDAAGYDVIQRRTRHDKSSGPRLEWLARARPSTALTT